MNTKHRLILGLSLLTLPLTAFTWRGDKVAFTPAEGATVSKELSLEATFFLDDIVVSFDGQEVPADQMAADEGLLIDATIGVTDEYAKVSGAKVLTLLRTFDELALEAGPESKAEDVEPFAELEDATVEFVWDAESGEYVARYPEDEEGNEDLLEGLDADMDLLALLPDGEVSIDDTWDVSGEGLEAVFLPGGIPGMESPDDPRGEEIGEIFKEELQSQLEGAFGEFAVHCKYVGSRDEDGALVGEISFEYDGKASIDLSEAIQRVIDLMGEQMGGVEADVVATVDLEFEGKGTLLWNLAEGHVHGFDMKADITVLIDIEADGSAAGQSHSIVTSAEVSGEATWSMTTGGE